MDKIKRRPIITAGIWVLMGILVSCGGPSQEERHEGMDELSHILEKEYSQSFGFSALIEIDTVTVLAESYGFSDRAKTTAANENTLFNIASISKSITAAGIMKLVENDQLSLSDTLGRFFEEAPPYTESISVEMLLSHSSGLPQTYPLMGISDSDSAIQLLLAQKLAFTPGSNFRYSNQNYQLLALIIEKVSGTTFEDYLRQEVLSPLHMDNTLFWNEIRKGDNLASFDNRIWEQLGRRNWDQLGASGIFSTATDLRRFWNGLYKEGFLSAESLAKIFRPRQRTSSGAQVGLGFFITPLNQWDLEEYWTRGSESWGHNAVIRYFPERNTTIIVLSNSGEIDGDPEQTGNRLISNRLAGYFFE